ncbi:MAG TPA: hypothetical protein VFC10_11240 [Terriglobia bacterium]|nr:hypothetical protein [Terriglobia bacterium]
MDRKASIVTSVICLAILGQALTYGAPARNQEKERSLAAKIERERNPGKKARLQIRLARLKLTDADAAYRERNFSEGKSFLDQYLEQVRNSWATIEGAQGGKHMGVLKDIEIALREDGRFLEDLRRRVPYPESEAIKDVARESSEVHNQVLEALFPTGFPQKGKSKHQQAPKSSNRVSARALKS